MARPVEILVRMAVPPARRRFLASESCCSPDLVSSTLSLNHTGNSDLSGMWHDIPSVCASPVPDWSGHQLLESEELETWPGLMITGASRGIGRGMAEELTDRGVPLAEPRTVLRLDGSRSDPVSVEEVAKAVALAIEEDDSRVPHPDRRSGEQPGPVCCPVGLVVSCNQA